MSQTNADAPKSFHEKANIIIRKNEPNQKTYGCGFGDIGFSTVEPFESLKALFQERQTAAIIVRICATGKCLDWPRDCRLIRDRQEIEFALDTIWLQGNT
jgi:hypothetical protein